jgi:hypothetical protein
LVLDLGVNVDWTWPRLGGEVASEVKRLARVLDGIRAVEARLGPGESLPEASLPLELFCQGARDAAAWTLGLSPAGPFHSGALPVSNATVELTVLSCRYLSTLGTELSLFAVGALAWLEWLIGEWESIEYPAAG